ncbi:3-deoxy-D-manno-octulosonic acid transferase [Lacinutrix salivirga]
MNFIYNILISISAIVLKAIGLFNNKIKQGNSGRAKTFKILNECLQPKDKTLWFHCASLGEYEQGLPVFEALRTDFPEHKIVLSFFSPSGYEIRKHSPIADCVIYLPLDSKKNASRFINLVNPELTVFVKYDIWPNYLKALKRKGYRAILISALFRENQIYFKWYGSLFKKALFTFEHIFTQDKASKKLLSSINYNATTVSGDTRFDRVSNQLNTDNTLDFVEQFKDNKLLTVIGSSWQEDEKHIVNYINTQDSSNTKFIIAPHNINENQINSLKKSLNKKTILYSEINNTTLKDFQVVILNTIGLLSKVYSYADIAYVGGAMGKTGLHNTLEPAVFGIPIIIGKNYNKFPEAERMISNGGMFSISNTNQLTQVLDKLLINAEFRTRTGKANSEFIKNNRGAVIQIMHYIRR